MKKKRQQEATIPLSDQIRAAVTAREFSRYRIAKETGISESTLSRFMSGERGLTTSALDTLAAFLDLHITSRPAEFSRPAEQKKG